MPLATVPQINGANFTQTPVYFVEDDPGFTAGGVGQQAGTGAGTGMQLSPEFTAPSAAAAIQVAHIIASALQRPVRIVTKYAPGAGNPPWTLVQGAAANVALTLVPSGVGY
jgi:hypothetical protein